MMILEQVNFQYQEREIIKDMSFTFEDKLMYGIIGPNGAGKTTLLQLLAGIDSPSNGRILLNDKPITSYSRKQLAKHIAVLQQGGLPALPFTVREIIEMGRFPYQSWLGTEQNNVAELVEEAIQLTGLTNFQNRRLEQLSGGERQRVALAKVYVQQPKLLLLDEPTTYLDIGNQQMIMDFVKRWQVTHGLTVIAVLHDLNTAALYCDQLIAMKSGALVYSGSVHDVLTKANMSLLYEAESVVIPHPDYHVPQLLLQKTKGD